MQRQLLHSNFLRFSLLTACLAFPGLSRAGVLDATIKAFENDPEYVKPIATLYGSITNSGWYQSARVGKGFGLYLGIPTSLIYVSDDDRSTSATFTDDGCVAAHNDNAYTGNCSETVSYTAPTIFGGSAPKRYRSVYDPVSHTIIDTLEQPINSGAELMAKLNALPFGMPQVGVSFFYTEVKLRYLAIPSGLTGDYLFLSMPGFGIQHDIKSFLPKILPNPLPVDISLAANFSWITAEFTPGEDIKGTLELSGSSQFYGILVGYKFAIFEAFLETGWEMASMETGGNLTLSNGDPVAPKLSLDGRNGFRAAINFALHFGYDAVIGQNIGANWGNQLSLLAFKL